MDQVTQDEKESKVKPKKELEAEQRNLQVLKQRQVARA